MKPLQIYVEPGSKGALSADEIRYSLRTLLETAGYPCRFLESGSGADIRYANTPGHSKLFIRMEPVERARLDAPSALSWAHEVPLFAFSEAAGRLGQDRREDRMEIHGDIVLAAFYFLTGQQENRVSRNSDDHHRIEETYSFQNRLNYVPVVDRYAAIIREIFSSQQEPLPAWPGGKRFAAALTHDVDYPEIIRWIECLRYAAKHKVRTDLRTLFGIASGKESFWKFDEVTALEKERGFRSTFFFCGFNRGSLYRYLFKAPDPFYDVEKKRFTELFRRLDAEGFEVGMHASYLSSESEALFMEEKKRIETVLGRPIAGNRQHYLRMRPDDPADTSRLHERAGLLYDSSLAFEQKAGFRRGTASPFHPYDPAAGRALQILEVAPTLMDDHLFGYRRYCQTGEWRSEIDLLMGAVRQAGGVCTLIYHPRVLNDTFYPGWGDSFRYWLKKIAENGDCHCDTLANLSKWRLERSRKIRAWSEQSQPARYEV